MTACADFPGAHWRKVWSTNPLERLNREVKHRTDVAGIFPDDASLLRLAACVLIEAHDECQVSGRRYLSEQSTAHLTPPAPTALQARRDTTTEEIDTTDIKTAQSTSTQSNTRTSYTPPRDAAVRCPSQPRHDRG